MALKMTKSRAKAAPVPLSMDMLSREFTSGPSRAAVKDANEAARNKLDPRINAIMPPLPMDEAQLLDFVVTTHEAQGGGVKQGVDLASHEIMDVMGVDRETATKLRSALIARGLLVQHRETMMDGAGNIFRPGPLPAAAAG